MQFLVNKVIKFEKVSIFANHFPNLHQFYHVAIDVRTQKDKQPEYNKNHKTIILIKSKQTIQ